MFSWLREPKKCKRIVFLGPAWTCARQVALDGFRDGVEDGACLVGFVHESARSHTAFVTNVLRGQRRRRSPGLLDSTPDNAEMAEQMEELDRRSGGLLFNLGRIHRHPGRMTYLSSTDTTSYENLCREGGLAGILCPILTTPTGRKVDVTGHVYAAGDGVLDVPVQVMNLQEFLATWEEEPRQVRQAAACAAEMALFDVAGILGSPAESLEEPHSRSFEDVCSNPAEADLSQLIPSQPMPLPLPNPMMMTLWTPPWVRRIERSSAPRQEGPEVRRQELCTCRCRLSQTTARLALLIAMAAMLYGVWDLRDRVNALTSKFEARTAPLEYRQSISKEDSEIRGTHRESGLNPLDWAERSWSSWWRPATTRAAGTALSASGADRTPTSAPTSKE